MTAASKSQPRRALVAVSWVVAVLYCLLLVVTGRASPTMLEIQRDFGFPLTWHSRFLSVFHLIWTAPLGGVIAGILIWKDRVIAHRAATLWNLVSVAVLVAFVSLWLYVMLSGS